MLLRYLQVLGRPMELKRILIRIVWVLITFLATCLMLISSLWLSYAQVAKVEVSSTTQVMASLCLRLSAERSLS
jgi:cell division septal protein FtsQ